MPKTRARSNRRTPHPDRHALYENAVQSPDVEMGFIGRVFRRLKGRAPRLLREDFCASALHARHWVAAHPDNHALAIDLDPVPLAAAAARIKVELPPHARARLDLRRADCLHPPPPPPWARRGFDVVAALNFSYWVFHTRADMLAYLRRCRAQLARDGLLVLDFMGGAECHVQCRDRSRRWLPGFGPYTYVWEHARVEPVSGRTVCKIHFEFPPHRTRTGVRPRLAPMRDAFTYHWRLWGIRELCDILADAGFARTRVFWEGEDARGEGTGIFRESTRGTPDRSYVGYIVAEPGTQR